MLRQRTAFNPWALLAVTALALGQNTAPAHAQSKENTTSKQKARSKQRSAPLDFHLGHVHASANKLGTWLELSNGDMEGPLSVTLTRGQGAWVMASKSATPPTKDPREIGATLLDPKQRNIHGAKLAKLFPSLDAPKHLFVYAESDAIVFIIHGRLPESEDEPQDGEDDQGSQGGEQADDGGEIIPGRGATGGSDAPADFIISTPEQWQAVTSQTPAKLSGKVAEIRGDMGQVTLRNIDIPDGNEPLYIRQGQGGSIRHLDLKGVVRNVYFQNIRFQMTGWPNLEDNIIQFGGGTFDKITFDGGSIRHGYGPSQSNFDVTKDYPEYKRVDHVQTATTSNKTYPLSWNDPNMKRGWIEFFNRGDHRVNVAIGAKDIQAPGPNECCAKEKCSCWDRKRCVEPGARVRFCGLDIADITHFSIRSDDEQSEVNARTEIGLSRYLANAFAASGSSKIGDLTFRNMVLSDLGSAFKGLGTPTNIVIMDNKIERIYMDTIAVAPRPGGASYVLRNLISTPFARSGIPEDRNGDAGDPHGDQHQMFGRGKGTIENVYSAGNRSIKKTMRPGVKSQGAFFSDNRVAPSYRRVFSISDMYLGGAGRGWSIGHVTYPASDVFLYGATIVDGLSFKNKTNVSARISPDSQMYIGRTFASKISDNPLILQDNNVEVEKRDSGLFFKDYAAASVASSRADIESALTSTEAYGEIGAVATRDAVNWSTLDAKKVIRWEKIPSGITWTTSRNVEPGERFESKKQKVLNRLANQSVIPDDGVQWQSLAKDGKTVIQNWTNRKGSIEPDQYLKIRFRAPNAEHRSLEKGVRINGFRQTKKLVTSATMSNAWTIGDAWFSDVENVPEQTTVIEYEAKFRPRSKASSNHQLFGQTSAGGFRSSRSGAFKVAAVEHDGGSVVYSARERIEFELGVVYVVNVKIDYATGEVTTSVNGEVVETGTMSDIGNGFAQSRRPVLFGSSSGRSMALPKDWEFEYLRVHFTTDGIRSLHKELSIEQMGSLTKLNADAWRKGGALKSP